MGKKSNSDAMPVFRLKPITKSNDVEIKYVGNCAPNEKLGDEIIEIKTAPDIIEEHGKFTDFIANISGYTLTCNIYKCNIIGSYLVNATALPLYNLQILYTKTVVRGLLMSVYVVFNMDDESRKRLKTPASHVNARISGSYSIELDPEAGLEDYVRRSYGSLEEAVMSEIMSKYNNVNDMTDEQMAECANEIETIFAERKRLCNKLIDKIQIPIFPNEKIIVENYLREMYRSKYFHWFLSVALEYREECRRKEMMIDDDIYEVPKSKITLDDIRNNPNFVEEYISREDIE